MKIIITTAHLPTLILWSHQDRKQVIIIYNWLPYLRIPIIVYMTHIQHCPFYYSRMQHNWQLLEYCIKKLIMDNSIRPINLYSVHIWLHTLGIFLDIICQPHRWGLACCVHILYHKLPFLISNVFSVTLCMYIAK